MTPRESNMTSKQYGATIQKPIAAGRLEPLRTLLRSIGDDIDKNPQIPFARLTSAHFLSWFIVDRDGFASYLIFELNVDGPIERFLDDLVAKAGPGIDLIYGHCPGYPARGSTAPGRSSRTCSKAISVTIATTLDGGASRSTGSCRSTPSAS